MKNYLFWRPQIYLCEISQRRIESFKRRYLFWAPISDRFHVKILFWLWGFWGCGTSWHILHGIIFYFSRNSEILWGFTFWRMMLLIIIEWYLNFQENFKTNEATVELLEKNCRKVQNLRKVLNLHKNQCYFSRILSKI